MTARTFITHNDVPGEPIDTSFCQLQGSIQATRLQLAVVFGPPLPGRDAKIQHEWHIVFHDTREVATIYSWKEPLIGDDDVIAWRIGGQYRQVVERVHAAFRDGYELKAKAA